MYNLTTLGTLCPEGGLTVVGLVLDKHVVAGDIGPAVWALPETWWVLRGRGHGWFQWLSEGGV